MIRFTVTSQYTTEDDIERDWSLIVMWANDILAEDLQQNDKLADVEEQDEITPPILKKIDNNKNISDSGRIKREGLKMKKKDFGMSLVLSNVPMSPKFINGSFVALFDDNNDEILLDYAKHLGSKSFDCANQPIRMSPRKRFREQPKQYSFDCTPAPRRPVMPSKQGSLDSKIEDIFTPSLDSSMDMLDDVENGYDKSPTLPLYEGKATNGDGDHGRICEHCGSRLQENGRPLE